MTTARRGRRWYDHCRIYLLTPEAEREKVSRQALAHYGAIGRLPREMGEDLDERGAPQVVVRWIAWGPSDADRAARYAAASAEHVRTGRWPTAVEELRALAKRAL